MTQMSDDDLRLKVGTKIDFRLTGAEKLLGVKESVHNNGKRQKQSKWDIISKMTRNELEQKYKELYPEEVPDDETLRTKIFLESNRVKGQHHSGHSGAPKRAFIAELREMSHEALIKRYNELFPPVEEVPRTLGYSLQEDKGAWETARRTNSSRGLALHPRAIYSVLCQCRRCKLLITLECRKNGIPNGYTLELGNRIAKKEGGTLVHRGRITLQHPSGMCHGTIDLFHDSLPRNAMIYLDSPKGGKW